MTSSIRGALAGQIENRNYLSPRGFKFSLAKFPKVDFFCNSASIPEITLGTYQQPSYFCLLYTSPSPRDPTKSRMPSSA